MRHLEQIASLLFSEDPRSKAEKILVSLVAETDSRGGAVLAVRHGKLVVFVGQEIGLDELGGVKERFSTLQEKLLAGDVHHEGTWILAPIKEGSELVGVLYLESPRGFDLEDTAVFRTLLGKALRGPIPSTVSPTVASYLASQPAHETEKEQLIQMLQRNEWNIAVVSRKLGVTRRTVYLRMQRYGIDRKKVPRTMKKTPILT